ncbi:hypothetical protein [Nonomuraea sp. NPDC005692]|uniref:hypothetical protein n=1 Tax=Nonomuraea sp. NPDC005692 TaxID=3157168 RepID=UPI0033CB4EF9
MYPRKTALALGTAAALTLAAAGAVPATAAGPCARVSSTCSPADVAKDHTGEKSADVQSGVRPDVRKGPGGGKPRDGRPGCGPDRFDKPGKPGDKDHGVSQEAFAKALAAELGIGYDRALRAVKELDALTKKGRVDPGSAGFGTVAEHLGVTPDRLERALRNVKRALAGAEPA